MNLFDGKFGQQPEDEELTLDQLMQSLPALPAESPQAPTAAPTERGPNWGQMAMQGLAGLGDAITGAYGTNKTNFSGQLGEMATQAEKSAQVKAALIAKKQKEILDSQTKKTEMDDKRDYLNRSLVLKAEANKIASEQRDATRDSTNAYRDHQLSFQREKFDKEQAEKADKKTRLDDGDVDTVTAFQDAKRKMQDVVGLLGDNSNWTGSIDGRFPDAMIGGDQVRFRAEIGKLFDKYRKAITGAGAGPSELEMLLKRLPTETDTLANFKAKADSFINDSDEDLNNFLRNKQKQGKNVANYLDPGQGKPTPPKSSQPAPGGNTKIRQNGVDYEWDGSQYLEIPTMARR